MSVVSKTAATNTVSTFYVSCLAGPRLGKTRVAKGDKVEMSEHQARGLLLSGDLVKDEALVDDPFGEKAAAAKLAQEKAASDADAAAKLKAAADARAAADKAAATAQAADAEAEAVKADATTGATGATGATGTTETAGATGTTGATGATG